MRVGVIGLGKIGAPIAVILDAAGHDVIGFDVSPEPARWLADRSTPLREEGLPALLANHHVRTATLEDTVDHADIVFVTVQTPHQPAYDGTVPAPTVRADFEYGYLVNAVRAVTRLARKPVTVVVVSTVLPGTFNRHLRPLATNHARLIYSPCFVAMGSVVHDFRHPEFVLCGVDPGHGEHVERLEAVHAAVHDRPVRVVSIESAELTKVAYNVAVSAKIAQANWLGELCAKTGADADEVSGTLALATDRLVSARYTNAGMGDSGACHPRDLIAMSWLAERVGMSYDYAAALMDAREAHSTWLGSLIEGWADLTHLPVVVAGKAYKPESTLTAGSAAALLVHQLTHRGIEVVWWDPLVDGTPQPDGAAVWFVATAHDTFRSLTVEPGSVVLDPFGIVADQAGVTTVRIGRK